MVYVAYAPQNPTSNHPVAQVLGLKADSLMALTTQIQQGLPMTALESLGHMLGVNQAYLANLVGVSMRTLQRTKESLSPAVSDHVYRLGNLLDNAICFHGTLEDAVVWLKHRNIALNGVTPLEYARTEAGTQIVLDMLGGLEHGVVQ